MIQMNMKRRVRCNDSRDCFAAFLDDSGIRRCQELRIVTSQIAEVTINGKDRKVKTGFYRKDGQCPFCKPVRDVTNGKRYPLNNFYGK